MYNQYKVYFFLVFILISSLSADTPEIPKIAVSGQALLKKPADEATLVLGVTTQAVNAIESLQENSKAMQRLIDALVSEGMKEGEYKTGRFSISQVYSERPKNAPEDWRPKVISYRVDNRLEIKSQQLDQIGGWIDKAVAQGATNVDSISFDLHDPRVYRDEAIQVAVQNAKNDALAVANSMNVRLGRVLSVRLDQAYHSPVFARQAYAMKASPEISTPIVSGDIDVQANVSVEYEIIQ